jgi:hypothetical protein
MAAEKATVKATVVVSRADVMAGEARSLNVPWHPLGTAPSSRPAGQQQHRPPVASSSSELVDEGYGVAYSTVSLSDNSSDKDKSMDSNDASSAAVLWAEYWRDR